MDNAVYATLTRQSGLLREMQTVANNIANISTTGFRGEGVIFAEHVAALGADHDSLSMAAAVGRHIRMEQGALAQTGGSLDFAIEGDGFFLLQTADGEALTRAGHFMPNAEGELVNADGQFLLDAGGAPIFIPPDARSIELASDGTLSADGRPLTVLGLWQPIDPNDLRHQNGVQFVAEGGAEPAPPATLLQGFLEESNVNPIAQMTRMIEVQRSYELGQSFLDKEDERMRAFLRTVGART
ncbi:flagellar hook-basal body complex protein [Roseobacter sp. HKCCD9010]|uniref:flagellar hook-basal body complex protein n=1 Tax=unclassified Roseobacter TaxID=196798 RepID=UPI0014931B94|nr:MULTISPECIES: flagellar hook-basal body complex protein [unclassified Roseobacter]MBF9050987.1 flagellar hook-basal body complex protein [Rhodobacterales bacterium HKCCD4356]NNV12756.1 flagellar hook-basal body complex protein [Roseobacter sp. HKCCD7357]NNV16700.1 flagellar hook-basal body complex protein [Roseobacter sp. HKCCD8768]NNV26668.1 flagellar hook-basal body complex protein [Roseobacter sp. HKCCD8192]NNV30419.1 flagellar hook-basal body complex protein [Roseobacter sp. HKCCD9061]